MKKKIISLIIFIIGIIFLVSSLFIKNLDTGEKINNYSEYNNIKFTHISSKKVNNNYQNTIKLEQITNPLEKIDKVLIVYFDKKENIIESNLVNIEKIYSKSELELTFLSKNNLNKYDKFLVYEFNNYFNVNDSYQDTSILINNFHYDNNYCYLDITNLQEESFNIENFSINFYNDSYEYLFSFEFSLELDKKEKKVVSISNLNSSNIKYIMIDDYS